MARRKSSSIGFTIFMLLYIVVLCAAALFGLRWLWGYLESYEAAQSTSAVDDYENKQMQQDFENYLKSYADSLATPFQTGDDVFNHLQKQLGEVELHLKKDRNADSSRPQTYSIRLNQHEIGKLYTKKIPLSYGLEGIAIDHTEWKLETDPPEDFQVIAPEEAVITVNGIALSSQNSTVKTAEHSVGELTKEFDPVYDTQYTFSYFGIPEPQIGEGQSGNYTMEQDDSKHFSVFARCDEQTIAALKPLAEQFVRDYISFTSNAGSYGIARNHMVPDSPLYARVSGSIDGMKWVAGVTATISDLTVDNFVPFGEGVICDAHYKLTDIMGGVMESNMRILYVQYWGTWKVYNIQMF